MRIKNLWRVALVLVIVSIGLIGLYQPVMAAPSDAYWVGGTGTWYDATNHWATTSGGAPDAGNTPGTNTNVHFDANSFTGAGQVVTVDVTASCKDMDWTGATNTPSFVFTGQYVQIYGSVTFIAAMSSTGGTIRWWGTGSQSLTTNGLALNATISIGDVGTPVNTIVGNASFYPGNFNFNLGTLNTNGTITSDSFNITGAGAKTLTLGASVINCTAWVYSGSNLTLNPDTSTIKVTGSGAFTGGGVTYNDVELNGTSHTVSGSNTFHNLTRTGTATRTDEFVLTAGTTQIVTGNMRIAGYGGGSLDKRLLVRSTAIGSAATIKVNGVWTDYGNADFMDITDFWGVVMSSSNAGDCGGNTNITFPVGVTQTWNGTTGNWSDSTKWTSRVPLPQDDVTAGGTGNTITVDMPRIGKSVTFTGSPTVTLGNSVTSYGSLTLASGMTYTTSTYTNTFGGREAYTLTTNGKPIRAFILNAPGGTLTLQDNLNYSQSDTSAVYTGTLDTNSKAITGGIFLSNSTGTRAITLGATSWELYNTGAVAKWNLASTGMTLTAGTSTIILTNSSANAQTFAGGSLTYNNVTVQGSGAYALTVTGSNTFNTFRVDASQAAKSVKFTDGTTTTVADITRDTGTNIITLNGTAAAGWTLTKTDATPVSLDYLSVDYSNATQANVWYAGTHSTDGTHNTNWTFNDPAITVTTTAATGVTMDKDGVTGGNYNGTMDTDLDGSPRWSYWFEYGLTPAYGSVTANMTSYDTPAMTIAVLNNLTPGATYHYRLGASNGAGMVYGADKTFTYTMPTAVTTDITALQYLNSTSAKLNGNVTDMGVASDAYIYWQYGYSTSYGFITDNKTFAAIGPQFSTVTDFSWGVTLHAREVTQVGSVIVYGDDVALDVPYKTDPLIGLTPTVAASPVILFVVFIFGTVYFGRRAVIEPTHRIINISITMLGLVMGLSLFVVLTQAMVRILMG